MVIPLPKIEGFQPIPNAVMIPFMEAQSAALAFGFGLNYEYGKRKIRSMSNTEFNSLTSEDITNMSNNHTHIILSKFQEMVPSVMPMQREIFKQYVKIEQAKVIQNIELAQWIVDYIATGSNQAIEQFFGNLFSPTSTLPPSTLNPDRPTTTTQVATSSSTTAPSATLKIPTSPNKVTRHTMSTEDRNKFIINNNNATKLLIDAIIAYIPKINYRDRTINVTAFKNGGFPFPDHSVLRKMYLEYIRHRQYQINVLAGVVPY